MESRRLNTAKKYTVKNIQEEQKPRGGLDMLPRHLQIEVLRQTAASFVVFFNYVERSAVLLRYRQQALERFSDLVPINACFEFKLEPRCASVPVMNARFTRAMDPAFKLEPEWGRISAAEQAQIENSFRCEAVFKAFTELRYDDQKLDEKGNPYLLFSFLRPSGVEDAPKWSNFPPRVLREVREKLETVFGLKLCYTPTWPSSGVWYNWRHVYM
jgi:hypothetical protein